MWAHLHPDEVGKCTLIDLSWLEAAGIGSEADRVDCVQKLGTCRIATVEDVATCVPPLNAKWLTDVLCIKPVPARKIVAALGLTTPPSQHDPSLLETQAHGGSFAAEGIRVDAAGATQSRSTEASSSTRSDGNMPNKPLSESAPVGDTTWMQKELAMMRQKLDRVEMTLNEINQKLERIISHMTHIGAGRAVANEVASVSTTTATDTVSTTAGKGLLAQVDAIRAALGPDVPKQPLKDAVVSASTMLGLPSEGPIPAQVAAITALLGL